MTLSDSHPIAAAKYIPESAISEAIMARTIEIGRYIMFLGYGLKLRDVLVLLRIYIQSSVVYGGAFSPPSPGSPQDLSRAKRRDVID